MKLTGPQSSNPQRTDTLSLVRKRGLANVPAPVKSYPEDPPMSDNELRAQAYRWLA